MPAHPWIWLDGRFLSEAEASVPIDDRSFRYGDGLFETLRVYAGRPFAWADHWGRLQRGAARLRIPWPANAPEPVAIVTELLRLNSLANAVLRIQLSRGPGPRGHSSKHARTPLLLATVEPAPAISPAQPAHVSLATSPITLLAEDPLASIKTTSRLPYLLARLEAEEAGADEALLLNHRGNVAETDSANLFWIRNKTVCTPPLNSGAFDGITRRIVLTLCRVSGIDTEETDLPRADLTRVTTFFLTSSVREIARVTGLDGQSLAPAPLVDRLHRLYHEHCRISA